MAKPEVLLVGSRPDWYVERLAEDFTLHRIADDNPSLLETGVAQRIEVVASGGVLRRPLIEALPRLRLVVHGAAGFERVDVDALRERRILMTTTPGVADGCVADMAFALLLAVGRSVVPGDRFVRAGLWSGGGDFPLVPRLFGRPVGILGLGGIGLAIARRAAGFDMPVFYHNRRPREDVPYAYCDSPLELARRCDVFMVACPGGDETRHIVNAEVLDALGSSGIIVNIARGSIIDEGALIVALREKRIFGAGLVRA